MEAQFLRDTMLSGLAIGVGIVVISALIAFIREEMKGYKRWKD